MKAKRVIMILLLSIITFVVMGRAESFQVKFSPENFICNYDEFGKVSIVAKGQYVYGTSPDNYCIPIVPVNVAFGGGLSFDEYSVRFNISVYKENVDIAKVVLPEINGAVAISANDYSYSADNSRDTIPVCEYVSTSTRKNITLMRFAVSPFIYKEEDKKLYFVSDIYLEIKTKLSDDVGTLSDYDYNPTLLSRNVINPEKIEFLVKTKAVKTSTNDETIDYLIITNEALKDSFQKLLEWKRTKGLNAVCRTIEEIEQSYVGTDMQFKIKSCIKDLYDNHHLKYILLGGDKNIVPVKYCYASNPSFDINDMPSDMYYACLGEPFDWDSNCNGIFAEADDKVDLLQDVCVTRLPVRTGEDVRNFTEKLLGYEQSPEWKGRMLMAGVKTQYMHNEQSDSEYEGNRLYEEYIKGNWDGQRIRFYDTYTDFEGGSYYDVDVPNLTEQLKTGYDFVDMSTHGDNEYWVMEKSPHYNTIRGSSQVNEGYSIITTSSCFTNAFDSRIDPCLSESLIRNNKSGIVSYLGCSRQGFGYTSPQSMLSPSNIYNAKFYQSLFSKDSVDKCFGDVVRSAKDSMEYTCNRDNFFKWIMLGLNPIGDPEMPIYISLPKKFNDVSLIKVNNRYYMNIDGAGARVAIYDGSGSLKGLKRYHDIRQLNISDISPSYSVCVTRQNFIPQVTDIRFLQNCEFNEDDGLVFGDFVIIGEKVMSNAPQGKVVFSKGITTIEGREILMDVGTVIEKGAEVNIVNR